MGPGPHQRSARQSAAERKAGRPVERKEVAEEDVPSSVQVDRAFCARDTRFRFSQQGARRGISAPGARKSIRPAWACRVGTSSAKHKLFLVLSLAALLCPALPGSGCDHRMREFELGRDHESSHETCAPGRRGMCQDVPRMPSGRTEVTVIRGRPLNELQPTVPACKHEGA